MPDMYVYFSTIMMTIQPFPIGKYNGITDTIKFVSRHDVFIPGMAPLGSLKRDPDGQPFVKGSDHYVSHRQDQAVLALLVSNYTLSYPDTSNVNIISEDKDKPMGYGFSSPYFCIRTNRGKGGPFGGVWMIRDWKKEKEINLNDCKNQSL